MHTSNIVSEKGQDTGQADPEMSTGEVCYPVQQSTSSDKAVSTVCRSLFGPTDHDKNRQFVRRELAMQRQKDREEWNFDFDQEMPLEGRYEWMPVREPYRLRSAGKEKSVTHHHSKSDASCSKPGIGGVTQSRIPDYMKKRKQTTRSKSASRSLSPKAE